MSKIIFFKEFFLIIVMINLINGIMKRKNYK
nr:MAG TPA: hypothetical protein [Caudoviricetes sp.]